jgi:(E)-4-hydroxy-3-methylbut-2-enyl-diphosphate synthase
MDTHFPATKWPHVPLLSPTVWYNRSPCPSSRRIIQTLSYSPDLFAYRRRKTRVVMVGDVGVGGENPLRLQSMTTTRTQDTEATVDQAVRLIRAGCEIVRITAPTEVDAANLKHIAAALHGKGLKIPLVADIHFRPEAAMEAANHVEKVRINPGNFSDAKAFKIREYSDAQYREEIDRIEERFTPLVLKLKRLGRALRIGTNHGSLSDRILNRYGDTPEGMVESALEFVRICERNGYHDIILSMKASNPKIMIAAYRLARGAHGRRKHGLSLSSGRHRSRGRGRWPHQVRCGNGGSCWKTASATPFEYL